MNIPVELTKVVRSKDVLDTISEACAALKGQELPASYVGMAIYQRLSKVPEFYAEGLTEVVARSLVEPKESQS